MISSSTLLHLDLRWPSLVDACVAANPSEHVSFLDRLIALAVDASE